MSALIYSSSNTNTNVEVSGSLSAVLCTMCVTKLQLSLVSFVAVRTVFSAPVQEATTPSLCPIEEHC